MRSFYARGVAIALGMLCVAKGAQAQMQYAAPSVLTTPRPRQVTAWQQPAGYQGQMMSGYGANYSGYNPQSPGPIRGDVPQFGPRPAMQEPIAAPAYPAYQYRQPIQAQPQFGPQYGQPLQGQPQYGQPLQGQPQYTQSPPGQPQYAQPQFNQPQSGPSPYGTQPQIEQVAPGVPQPQYDPYSPAGPEGQWGPHNNSGTIPWGGGYGGYGDGAYGSGYGSNYASMGEAYAGGGMGYGNCGRGCGRWFGSVGTMAMAPTTGNMVWLSNNTASPYDYVLTTNDAQAPWGGGGMIQFGRYFNCGMNAIQAVYWGVYPGQASGDAYEANLGGGSLWTLLPFDGLAYDNGVNPFQAVILGYDDATHHQVVTQTNFQNVEINLLGFSWGCGGAGSCCGNYGGGGGYGGGGYGGGGYGGGGYGYGGGYGGGYGYGGGNADGGYGGGGHGCGDCGDSCGGCQPCCNRLRVSWLSGFRYFQFSDYFLYKTDPTDTIFGNDEDELAYQIKAVNNLFGWQIGGRMDYCLMRRWSVYCGPKVGIYSNYMTVNQHIGGTYGCAVVEDPASPYYLQEYDINVNRTDFALLGEFDIGTTFYLSCCWSASLGYRMVGASGVALTTNQIPQSFSDLGYASGIHNNGSLILQGAYATVNFNW